MGVIVIRTEWAGTTGGPGLTQMCVNGFIPVAPAAAQTMVNAVRTFWNSLAALLPNELTLTVSPIVDSYDPVTGDLDSTIVVATPPLPVVGTSSSNYAGGAGLKVKWETNTVKNGKRVRGSTFIVPAASAAYSTTGDITGSAQTTVNNAAAALISAIDAPAQDLTVWSRPRLLPTPRDGDLTDIVSGVCSSKTAILRSRRD
jgi:hypothetical protein